MEMISARAQAIQPSMTLTISAKAKAMKADGLAVLDFSAGEPDFDTPEPIKQAAIKAIHEGFTKYTAAGGTPELKAAIGRKYEDELGMGYEPAQILVSNGGKHALHSVLQALLDPGDEVVIPAPYWVSYPDMVRLSGGTPVIVPTLREDDYKISAAALEAAIAPRTKAFILNSPGNPTGTVYSAEELTALAEVLKAADILTISDDVYEKYVYDGGSFASLLHVAPELRSRMVIINSASKTYSMPGWRMGYALGPAPLITAATRIQGQATSCAGSISQKALTYALKADPIFIAAFRRSFEYRRNLMYDGLSGIDGIRAHRPAGAFYQFADVSGLMARLGIDGSIPFCEYLLDQCQVASIPGKAFGDDRCIRFCFVADEADIAAGIERLARL